MHRVSDSRLATCGSLALLVLLLVAGPAVSSQSGILSDSARPEADRARDAGSKPLAVFEWLGVRSGMSVADVIPGSGYNSHVLGLLVGADGQVHSAGTTAEGKVALEQRFDDAGLGNVAVHEGLASLPDAALDVVVIVRNVHDMLTPDVAEQYGMQPDSIFVELTRALKPGGVLGVVDSRMPGEGVDAETHRISEAMVIAELEARGFELVDRSELLADPDDDFAAPQWGDGRAFMDRMLLKFRKSA